MSDTRKDVVIIGSGPAGLSAAVYAKRALLDVAVIEKEMFSGGQIVTTDRVDNLLGFYGTNGYDLSVKFRKHADALEVPFMEGTVTDIANQDDYKEVHLEDGSVIDKGSDCSDRSCSSKARRGRRSKVCRCRCFVLRNL